MRTAHYRPEVKNGQVRSRRVARASVSAGKSRPAGGVDRRARGAERGTAENGAVRTAIAGMSVAGRSGLMVMATIIVAGLVVGAGFVLALQTQNRIYRIGVDEARLKAQLHQISNRQRVESLAQEQVFNQVETMALVQPGLAAEAPRETAAVASATPSPVRLRDESALGKPSGKLAARKSEAGKKALRGDRQSRQVATATSGGAAKLRRQVVRTTTRGSAAAKSVRAPARRGETRRQR